MTHLAIFGTGALAAQFLDASAQLPDSTVVSVADNAASGQGTSWRGFRVESAAALVRRDDIDRICIASSWHGDISAQLLALGAAPRRIYVYDPWQSSACHDGLVGLRPLIPASGEATGIVSGFEGDHDRLRLLERLGFSPRVVLDVGASNGPWSVTCARVYPQAAYYLIEPLPHYEGALMRAPAAGWTRLPVAVGDHDGTATMTIPVSDGGKYRASMLEADSAAGDRVLVPLRRIDGLIDDGSLPPPDLVKLDVQGAEAAVLRGGTKLWASAEVFLVELSMDRYWEQALVFHEMVALFAGHGFMPFDFFHEFRGPDGVLAQIDAVFLKADGPLAAARRRAGGDAI